jgi:choline dehydrogenase-like flavoprotein
VWGAGSEPHTPGRNLHETGTPRMDDDHAQVATKRFGQAHDVLNLFVQDARFF